MSKKKKIKQDNQAPVKRLYVKSISLDNFKSFKENSKINLAPMVNLIFGQNSAGKSSIFQALRLFRQSYSPGSNMSVLNYEAPLAYRGKGGLDIDIGFEGIVNERKINKQISLGVGIGTYNKSKDELLDDGELKFKFKYVPKFYKGKNLIKNKTIPSKISFSDSKNFISIDLIKHHFFKEDDEKFRSLLDTGKSFRRIARRMKIAKKDTSPYGALYDPFFFSTRINKDETKIVAIDEVFDAFQKVDKKKIFKILIATLERLKEGLLSKKKKNKKKEPFVSYGEQRAKLRDIKKKMNIEFFNKDLEPEKRLSWLLNNVKTEEVRTKTNQGDAIDVFYEEFLDTFMFLNKQRKITQFILKIKKLSNFLNKKNINKKIFYDYFLNDIIQENKDLIFFNGDFKTNPSKKKRK